MSNYSFKAHAASDRRKWIAVAVAFVLTAAIIVTGCLTDWFSNWNKYCVFGHDYDEDGICTRCGKEKLDEVQKDKDPVKEPEEDNKEAAVNGGGMATVLPGNGIRLMAAKMAPTAGVPTSVVENTWTLTASVNEHADDKYINWSVRWKDVQASWAQGKTVTDYLTVTPTAAGALTATVKVVKDFGAQIEVVATSRDNSEKSAVCVFDYVQKITGITFNMPSIKSETTSFTYEFETTAYTVAAEMKIAYDNSNPGSLSTEFMTKFVDLIGNDCDFGQVGANKSILFSKVFSVNINGLNSFSLSPSSDWYYSDGSKAMSKSQVSDYLRCSALTDTPFYNMFGVITSTPNASNVVDQLSYYLRQTISQVESPHFTFGITFTATYNDKTYSSGSKIVEGKFDGTSLHVPVTDLTLSESHIYA